MNTVIALAAMASMNPMNATHNNLDQYQSVHLDMTYFESFENTEVGNDEVYAVVVGRWSAGNTFSYRLPQGLNTWDMGDLVGQPPLGSTNMANLTMSPDSVVDVAIVFMEDDGGVSGGWRALAQAAIHSISPGGDLLADELEPVISRSSDDYLGSIQVRIFPNGGRAYARIIDDDRAYDLSGYAQNWRSWYANFDGARSDYHAKFTLND